MSPVSQLYDYKVGYSESGVNGKKGRLGADVREGQRQKCRTRRKQQPVRDAAKKDKKEMKRSEEITT